MLRLTLLVLLATTASGQISVTETYTHSATLRSGGIKLYWKFTEEYITFEVHGQTTGWIGIGWSPNGAMTDSDIIVGWVKGGQVTITDRHGASSNTFPPLDTEQNVEVLAGEEADGWTMYKFKRPLAACEADHDREITSNTQRLIYAWGNTDPTGDDITPSDYHSTNKGVESMYFLSSPDSPSTDLPQGPTYLTYDVLNEEFEIPAQDTHYNCRLFKLPELSEKHHIVKIEPIIQEGNELNVHHMLLYQCGHNLTNSSELGVQERCYSPNMQHFATCTVVIAAWAIGGGAFVYPAEAGYSIGTAGDPTIVQLETHYDNPTMGAGRVDNSGLRITYTTTLREFDVGVIEVGNVVSPYEVFIPPNAESFLNVGYCPTSCLNAGMTAAGVDGLNVFAVNLHSHLAGRSLRLRHIRNGAELPYLASDTSYDFNYQEFRHRDEIAVVQPGDVMRMECVYNTEGRTRMTEGGFRTQEEMCMAFVAYYPKIDVGLCYSSASTDQSWPYFGILNIDLNNITGLGLDHIYVTAPPELEGLSVMDVMSGYDWNETTIDKFAQDLQGMKQNAYCSNSEGNQAAEKFDTPEIKTEYQVSAKKCPNGSRKTQSSPFWAFVMVALLMRNL